MQLLIWVLFQKKQVKTNISLAEINYQNAELQEIDTKNLPAAGLVIVATDKKDVAVPDE